MKQRLFEHKGGNVFSVRRSPFNEVDDFEDIKQLLSEGTIAQKLSRLPMAILAGAILMAGGMQGKSQDMTKLDTLTASQEVKQSLSQYVDVDKFHNDALQLIQKSEVTADDIDGVLKDIEKIYNTVVSNPKNTDPVKNSELMLDALVQQLAKVEKNFETFYSKSFGTPGAQQYHKQAKKYINKIQLYRIIRTCLVGVKDKVKRDADANAEFEKFQQKYLDMTYQGVTGKPRPTSQPNP